MTFEQMLQEQYEETRLIIAELIKDGSDPEALYTVEHHFSSEDFDLLEKVAVEAFKLGYEVTEPEELDVEDGLTLFCCDIFSEMTLDAELIDEQVSQLAKLAMKYEVNYDGWGTYFEGDEEEDDDDDEDRHDQDY